MNGRRAVAILSILAAAGVLAAVAAWFLGGGPAAPDAPPDGDPPSPPRGTAKAPGPAADRPARPPWAGPARRVRAVPPVEEDAPPTPEVKAVPKTWKPWARLRFLDAKTRTAIPFTRGRVALIVSGGSARRIVPEPFFVAGDGRVEVFRWEYANGGVLPFGIEKADWEKARVEVRVRGYEPREFASRSDLEGERDVELTPAAPSVTGTLRVAPALEGKRIRLSLEPADPGRDPRNPDVQPWVDGEDAGPFAWYDVPDGKWRFDVWISLKGNDLAHVTRTFEKAGTTVDLGEVAVHPPSYIRARVVSRDGTGVLDQGLTLEDVKAGTKEAAVELDESGWTEFRNLEADTDYRVASSLEDDLAETIHTPVAGGGDMKVELRWNNEGVRCRLRFTVDGQDPIQWGDLFEAPVLDKGSWKKDGFLDHDMAAGDYLFGAWARPRGKDKPIRVFAKFTVPSRPLWEATVDMKEDLDR